MKAWTQLEVIVSRLRREWERGRILGHLWGSTAIFPYRLSLTGPTSHDMVDHYQDVQQWIREVRTWQKPGAVVEWRDFNHGLLGQNQVPIALTITTAEVALEWIGKTKEAEEATAAFRLIEMELPELKAWAVAHPLQVLASKQDWPRLIKVVDWIRDHPRSGVYLRQVDVPGVDTKFLETHRGILMEILDQVLDPGMVDHDATGVAGFETRYGFLRKPEMVRFRFLDPHQSLEGLTDLTISRHEFATLRLPVRRVFMMENEIEFLAFPRVPESLAVFGAGYGLKRFQEAQWLSALPLYYWGDLDTHGFAILDELRRYVPQAQALLMDEETLLAFQEFWDREHRPSTHTLTRLTDAENALYEKLQQHHFGDHVRLEQERIPFHWLMQRLSELGILGS
ncbi:MAG: DUF2220 family protein [Sulfobacillus thermotolerans]|nr:DUF2220 family protein [Sulfobacillus thermotolerans]